MELRVITDPATGQEYRFRQVMSIDGIIMNMRLKMKESGELFAAKVFRKTLLTALQKTEIDSCIAKASNLFEENISSITSAFENERDMFILSKYYFNQTLQEMLTRRTVLTQREVRFFVKQIILALVHLKQQDLLPSVIELKHFYLDCNLIVKYDVVPSMIKAAVKSHERKETNPPNKESLLIKYIGSLIYKLLLNRPFHPPAKNGELNLPNILHIQARKVIVKLINCEFEDLGAILNEDFFTSGVMPLVLPKSCLSVAPRVLYKADKITADAVDDDLLVKPVIKTYHSRELDKKFNVEVVELLIKEVLTQDLRVIENMPVDATRAAVNPLTWITSWQFSKYEYRIAYSQSDNTIGIVYRDYTIGLSLEDTDHVILFHLKSKKDENIPYVRRRNDSLVEDKIENINEAINDACSDDESNDENRKANYIQTKCSIDDYPSCLEWNMRLLFNCRQNMCRGLSPRKELKPGDTLMLGMILEAYYSNPTAVIFCFSNGLVQACCEDCVILICSKLRTVSISKKGKRFRTYYIHEFRTYGITRELLRCIKTTSDLLNCVRWVQSSK